MTGLGAAIYGGFFVLSALWLFISGDRDDAGWSGDQGQRPERSNSTKVSAGPSGASPWLATQSSLK